MQLGWDGVEDTKAKRYAKELCFFLFFFLPSGLAAHPHSPSQEQGTRNVSIDMTWRISRPKNG